MRAKVIFMERDGLVRLVVTNKYGVETYVMFEKVSSLLNYAKECGISVPVAEIVTEGGKK